MRMNPAAGGLLLCLVLLVPGCARISEGLRSQAPAEGTVSAARFAPGPFDTTTSDLQLVDESRATMANEDFAGAPSRTLEVSLLSPSGAQDPVPLIVYSHGFSGNRTEMRFLLEHLAGHGYGIAALDFPLTNGDAPGGPNFLDLAGQPGDVRFVIDSLLSMSSDERGFAIDEERIGLMGLSYGGLTTTLLGFHETEAEPRAKGAISIAGPAQMFSERFFAAGGPPFLMIAGTEDAIVPHALNAETLLSKAPAAALLSLDAGTHLGFVEFGRFWMRFSHHPDGLACTAIRSQFEDADDAPQESPFDALGSPEDGIDGAAWDPPCGVARELPQAMRPQRQHALTSLAVRAFFDSLFADDPADRQSAAVYLSTTMPQELGDARYSRR